MRTYILTNQERKIIQKFLENGDRLENFRVLLHRCKHLDPKQAKEDLQLIQKFLDKA